ncbi:unnamed protein product [Dibothriocephalus latus]|uniref:Uncharacterized protein n=1 Tax=Dibothriocephalus latus TaxID=60516 RepID=A0A3P7NJF6_DIBLA|nr:unnamed protein product [Dibothriocephalus latus]
MFPEVKKIREDQERSQTDGANANGADSHGILVLTSLCTPVQ